MEKNNHHIAQVNIARMIHENINSAGMSGFVEKLEEINRIADCSKGFIWRLKDENNNATYLRPYEDEKILFNMSVWETLEDLKNYVYKSNHQLIMRDRKKWFEKFSTQYVALWYIPAGEIPTVEEAKKRIEYLQLNGPSEYAFDFKKEWN